MALFGVVFAFIVLIDSCTKRTPNETGIVRGHIFTPAHTTTSFMMVGETPIYTDEHHPDRWELVVEITNRGSYRAVVDHQTYDQLNDGDRVMATHTEGKIFDHGISDVAPTGTYY